MLRRASLVVLPTVLAAVLVAGAPPAVAATITVTTTADEFTDPGPGAGCALREAIRAARDDAAFGGCPAGSGPDVIVLGAGDHALTVLGTGDEVGASGDLDVEDTIEIRGAGIDATVVSAAFPALSEERVFDVRSGGGLTLVDLTVEDGGFALATSESGGGIRVVAGGAATLQRTRVRLSAASGTGEGGGIHSAGSLALIDAVVTDNTAAAGGGVRSTGSLTLDGSTISLNTATADDGGGILSSGTLVVRDSTIAENDATGGDGAGVSAAAGTLTIERSAVVDNEAAGVGGGLHTLAPTTIVAAVLDANVATGNGGGLALEGGATAGVTGSTVTGNRAVDGDGLWNDDGTLTIVNSTISGNGVMAGGGKGGGVRNVSGTLTLRNTTFGPNEASVTDGDGGNISTSGTASAANTILALAGSSGNCEGPVTSLGGNLEVPSPTFACAFTAAVDLGLDALGDNGGPTVDGAGGAAKTHALSASSPAIGAGASCEADDQRGVPRAGACDSGSYELALCAGVLVTVVGTDGDDLLPGTADADGVLALGGDDTIDAAAGDDAICAGPGDDLVRAGPGDDLVLGESGDDELVGASGDDTLEGGPGNDELLGDDGDDVIDGGDDDDLMFGGAGRDVLRGGAGNDDLRGEDAKDILAGGPGNDVLQGGLGHDRIRGQGGRDRAQGENGRDRIVGGGGRDRLAGGRGKDVLIGKGGRDRLIGGKQRDTLRGNAGRDRLHGGKGKDTCNGGGGRDTASACERLRKIP